MYNFTCVCVSMCRQEQTSADGRVQLDHAPEPGDAEINTLIAILLQMAGEESHSNFNCYRRVV